VIKHNHNIHLALGALLCIQLVACAEGNFTGNSASGDKKGTGPANPKTPGPIDPTTPPLPPPEGPLGWDDGKNCFTTQPKFNFMFIIDKTGSMDPSITTVIRKVGSFAEKIGGITLPGATTPIKDSQFGAVTYIDLESENMYVDFTKDPADFSAKLNVHHTTPRGNGGDGPEGGLMAAKVGLQRLGASISSVQSIVPVMIVVTDNLSHNGSAAIAGIRNFDESAVVDAAKAAVFKPLLIIDSSPTTGTEVFGLGKKPSEQWTSVREKIGTHHGRTATSMGAGIGFNRTAGFDENQLLTTIPNLIKESIKICP
jgi:hypothetical protein